MDSGRADIHHEPLLSLEGHQPTLQGRTHREHTPPTSSPIPPTHSHHGGPSTGPDPCSTLVAHMQMPMEITWNSRLHRWLGAASIVTSGVDADHPATPSPTPSSLTKLSSLDRTKECLPRSWLH